MKRFLVCATLIVLAFPAHAQNEDRSRELVDKALSGKDGAFEVMSEFAECSGFYKAGSEYAAEIGAEALSKNLEGLSNGAYMAALFFWGGHSGNPLLAVDGVKGGAEMHYKATMEASGGSSDDFAEKTKTCNSITDLQATIVQEMRKNY